MEPDWTAPGDALTAGEWHERPIGQIGIRALGLLILTASWGAGGLLYRVVHAHDVQQASSDELGLCASLVIGHLLGSVLLIVGPGLWQRVPVPLRQVWSISYEPEDHVRSGQDLEHQQGRGAEQSLAMHQFRDQYPLLV